MVVVKDDQVMDVILDWQLLFEHGIPPNSSHDSTPIEQNKPKAYFPTPTEFHETCLYQEFSIPMPLIRYVLFSSPDIYQKLTKCCKTFFIKYPVFIINYLSCIKFNSPVSGDKTLFYYKHGEFDMNKLKNKKIWISEKVCVFTNVNKMFNFASTFIPKIYRYDVKVLDLANQNLSYDDLKFLAAGVKKCSLQQCIIKYDNDEEVPLENIITLFSGAKEIKMEFLTESCNAACKSYDEFIDACQTVEQVKLERIPADFEVPLFYEQLKHSKNRSLISIDSRADADILSGIINEILQTQSFEFIPPVITHSWLNRKLRKKIRKIQKHEAEKYLFNSTRLKFSQHSVY